MVLKQIIDIFGCLLCAFLVLGAGRLKPYRLIARDERLDQPRQHGFDGFHDIA